MEIFMNNQKMQVVLEDEKTLGDLLNGLQQECENHNATIVAINVNDKNFSATDIEKNNDMALENVKSLKIESVCKDDVVYSFKEVSKKLPPLIEELNQVSVNFQTGKDEQANNTLKTFADFFNEFCNLTTYLALFPQDFSSYLILDKNVLEFLQDFSPILQDLENALKDQDTVLLGDLAEYEILPRVQGILDFCNKFED